MQTQIQIAQKRKDKDRTAALEEQFDALLEAGPTMPEPPSAEPSSDEEALWSLMRKRRQRKRRKRRESNRKGEGREVWICVVC